MNFLDHKNLGNHLLQLCPKVVKHPVYYSICVNLTLSQVTPQYHIKTNLRPVTRQTGCINDCPLTCIYIYLSENIRQHMCRFVCTADVTSRI